MSDKLTIKEIAPYLPYQLGLSGFQSILNARILDTWMRSEDYDLIPMLKPLDGLLLNENSGKIDPISIIVNGCAQYCGAYDDPDPTRILQAPYEVFEELLKEHFDVFSLIPRGLAIDINTIEPKTP